MAGGGGDLAECASGSIGSYRLEAVRPGDYLAVALDYVQQWQVNDPEFLEDLRDKATKVTLEEGQSAQLALKLKK